MKYEFSKCQRQGVKKQPGLHMITSTEECQPGHKVVVDRQHVCNSVDNSEMILERVGKFTGDDAIPSQKRLQCSWDAHIQKNS